MNRSVVETVLGALVLLVAGVFLAFSYQTADVADVEGYEVKANFSGIGGLKAGDDVMISGVKVGQIAKVELDPKTYLARVTMELDNSVHLPEDTAALISSQSLLGGRYLSIEPGGAEETIPAGGEIQFTQAPQNLEELLGKFIFSMKDGGKGQGVSASEMPAEPAPETSNPSPEEGTPNPSQSSGEPEPAANAPAHISMPESP